MQGSSAMDELMKREPRYSADAYGFVMDALAYTVKQIGERRHITGHELLYGIRDLALDSWGLMARKVLNSWGVRTTDDFGEIVFNMVSAGLLSKTEQDDKNDFKSVYGFVEAFDKSYSFELDEHGRVRRKVSQAPPEPWTSLFGDTGLN